MRRLAQFLLPRSLHARLFLLVLGAVLLTQAATLATVSYYRDKFFDEVAIGYIATTIRTLRASLSQVPAQDRAEFVRNASQNQWRLWSRTLPPDAQLQRPYRPPPGPSGRPPGDGRADAHASNDPLRRELRGPIRELNARLNDGTRVALSHGPEPEIFISLARNPDSEDAPRLREWLVIPLERLDPSFSTPMIAVWLGGLGFILLLAAGFSWHITRPLTRLAHAADQLAAGQPQRVDPSGPQETRALGERFNAMLDALAESDSVRRTLLSGLPHDLKGPLSRMWLRVEMADDPALKEGLRKDLQDMQRMVDQFIGFVRGTDPTAYRYAPLALPDWLADHVAGWTSTGTAITLDMPDEPMNIQADAVALGRLLDNLIGNALHHGAAPIDISLRNEGQYAVLDVADHGPGIAPERRAEALRPFARLDDARTRTGNVGLGLALAEAIARAHGGTLTLAEAASGGLLVRITFPLQG
ncbi:ATP-binding protein [Bordetella sp. 02P26C-1]|uniref:ATP-binding protein n=1 Tax=Bordetella sp. 02P26C-1 TaxID=2683195 RepID=UPI00135549FE|nr:ATP-binding protein [Bordetella sp. 02P26C-1]MVW77424.1 HAMP domain-containing protein [Bordetella sp. 02P26C-1]